MARGGKGRTIARRGLMLVLSSPSGAGKTTLSRMLMEKVGGLQMSVSATTRPMRPGEVEGKDYSFVDQNRFDEMVENGDLLIYLGKSDAFDENNTLLKLGRIRVKLTPNPFEGKEFKQELVLKDGNIVITGANNTRVTVWVDISNPVRVSNRNRPGQRFIARQRPEEGRF